MLLITAFIKLPVSAFNCELQFNRGNNQSCTAYQIGGRVETELGGADLHFPVSELKFPSSINNATVDVIMDLNERFQLRIGAGASLSPGIGRLEDSDWLKNDYSAKSIYSESDVASKLAGAQGEIRYQLCSVAFPEGGQRSFFAGAGVKYQESEYEASNLRQGYPAEPDRELVNVDGKVLSYTVKSLAPFWEFTALQSFGLGSANVSVGFAPQVEINDRDDHFLRSKLATGRLNGWADFWSAGLEYPFVKDLWWNVKYAKQNIQASGRQEQSRYADTDEGKAGSIASLDQKINSSQSIVTFGLEYRPGIKPDKQTTGRPQNSKQPAKIRPAIALSYLCPGSEREGTIGPHLELETDRFIAGAAFYQGVNKVQTLSKGFYCLLPVYGLFKWPVGNKITIEYGAGYGFNNNYLDPEAKSALALKGFPGVEEKVYSAPIIIVGAEIKDPASEGAMKYVLRYYRQIAKAVSKSASHLNAREVDLSAAEILICFSL